MDEKIRELCRSNLRENLKKVETEGELEKLDVIQDVPEAAEDEKEDKSEEGELKPDIEEDLFQIIQDALKRKAQDELPPQEELDRAQKKV
jgi:hypothetical protein